MLTEFYYYYYVLIEKLINWSKTVHDWPGRIQPFLAILISEMPTIVYKAVSIVYKAGFM
jgi:hypothetical protein